jgi:DNA invertase Pin-like site-specific DNA recombinase
LEVSLDRRSGLARIVDHDRVPNTDQGYALDPRGKEIRIKDCTLLLAEWDQATRSMWDGLQIVKQVLDSGPTIRVLDIPSLDLTTPEGRGFLALFSAMAERERIRTVKRTQEGRRLAIEAGKRMGRKPKLTAHQRRSARVRLANGESTRDVAKDFAVHHATIARLR